MSETDHDKKQEQNIEYKIIEQIESRVSVGGGRRCVTVNVCMTNEFSFGETLTNSSATAH